METIINFNINTRDLILRVNILGSLRELGVGGEETIDSIDASLLKTCVTLDVINTSGVRELKQRATGEGYTIDGTTIEVRALGLNEGTNRIGVLVQYGTNKPSFIGADVLVERGAGAGITTETIDMMGVKSYGGGGDGSTNKHLLQYDGGTTITENGVVLTHADIYDMLMNTPDFVVLVYTDHAYHPNLVTATQIVFTCSYASTGGDVIVERVTITSANVVTKLTQYAVAKNSVNSVAIGDSTKATGQYSFAQGRGTEAKKASSHAEGQNTKADGTYSHAEGLGSTTTGSHSHAEGTYTTASGAYSHAEGESTTANGYSSHAEGQNTKANNSFSHAEGRGTTANNDYSHAEGRGTTASGAYSHAEGGNSTADGSCAHAEGYGTKADRQYQHAQGIYNNSEDGAGDDGAFMHGCGTSGTNCKNAFFIASDGSIYVIGLGGYDGTNHTAAQSLQEIFGASIIQASANTTVNGYQVPQLTPDQVTQAYNSVVAGKSATITDATGNFHLGVMQADNLSGDLTISIIYLNVMLVSYTIDEGSVDIQYKNL